MIKELREAVAAAVNVAIPDIQCVPRMITNPTPPTAYVYPGPASYDLAMNRGLDSLELRVRAYISQTTDQGSQLRLDELLEPSGSGSMKAAIEADTTLGGLVGYGGCRVTGNSGYQEYQVQGHGPYLGSEWTLQIYASGG